jgi:hypothetical protein
MKKGWPLIVILFLVSGCATSTALRHYGHHYQLYKDYNSLEKVLQLLPSKPETKQVKKILGEPIDNGFDYRYLVDSTGAHHCNIGAVFHIDLKGKITGRWLDEICE